ncbi:MULTISPECIES: hypothetical protein [unclassified Helicobacter]|uniref:hypothetical protein n=1 Tax=unclassified Helicobacter TaxID=2593540 RepID=UPI0011C03756|nr:MULTISPECIES: hypothetical protein [unclassified Helicobacter]
MNQYLGIKRLMLYTILFVVFFLGYCAFFLFCLFAGGYLDANKHKSPQDYTSKMAFHVFCLLGLWLLISGSLLYVFNAKSIAFSELLVIDLIVVGPIGLYTMICASNNMEEKFAESECCGVLLVGFIVGIFIPVVLAYLSFKLQIKPIEAEFIELQPMHAFFVVFVLTAIVLILSGCTLSGILKLDFIGVVSFFLAPFFVISFFIAFSVFSYGGKLEQIDSDVKQEILTILDKTEQQVFLNLYDNKDTGGFGVCKRNNYSGQDCKEYINQIIENTKTKARELKDRDKERSEILKALISK